MCPGAAPGLPKARPLSAPAPLGLPPPLRPSASRTPPSALHSVRSLFPRQLRPTEGGGEGGVALRGGRDGAEHLRAGCSRCEALKALCRCARGRAQAPPTPSPRLADRPRARHAHRLPAGSGLHLHMPAGAPGGAAGAAERQGDTLGAPGAVRQVLLVPGEPRRLPVLGEGRAPAGGRRVPGPGPWGRRAGRGGEPWGACAARGGAKSAPVGATSQRLSVLNLSFPFCCVRTEAGAMLPNTQVLLSCEILFFKVQPLNGLARELVKVQNPGGAWVAHSVRRLTLGFSPGHDLPGIKPHIRLCTDIVEPAWDLSLPLPLSFLLPRFLSK